MGRRWAYRALAWAHGTVLTAHTGPGAHPTTVRGRRYEVRVARLHARGVPWQHA